MQTVTVLGVWLPGHVAQVAVWERDPRHPGGELYLTSGQVATVGLTPGVNTALARGSLELVGSTGSPTDSPTGGPAATEIVGAELGRTAEPTAEPPAAEPVEARPATKVTKRK